MNWLDKLNLNPLIDALAFYIQVRAIATIVEPLFVLGVLGLFGYGAVKLLRFLTEQ